MCSVILISKSSFGAKSAVISQVRPSAATGWLGQIRGDGIHLHITDISKLHPFFSGNPSIFTMQLQFEGNSLVTFSVLQAAMIIICVY